MRTKTILTIVFAALAIVSASAQSKKVVKQNRNVSEFSSITASSGWDVIVRQGNRQSVSIEVSEKLLDRAVVEVKNGTLHIYTQNKNGFSFSFLNNRNTTQKAYVTVTDLKEITASGGVDIRFETPLKATDFAINMSGGTDLENLSLNCNSFTGNFSGGCDADIRFLAVQTLKVDTNGGSDVNLYDIDAQQCRVGASGGCDVKLTGKSKEFSISASGGCDVSAADFTATNCTASFSGAADGKIRVSERLNISVSGASDVTCFGNPRKVEKSVNRGSSVTMR